MTAAEALGRQWEYPTRSNKHATFEIASQNVVTRNQRATGLFGERPDWDTAKVEDVPVHKLKPTQQFLWKEQHDAVQAATGVLPPVRVVRKGSAHYIVDGHHRVDRARLNGQKSIRAQVLER